MTHQSVMMHQQVAPQQMAIDFHVPLEKHL
jgi:hypothetical protein